MDTLTHIVTGACIGELIAGKTIGKKAMIIGAAAQLIPDIDGVAHLWLDNVHGLVAHRGITHSILFAVVVTVLTGFFAYRLLKKKGLSLASAFLLTGINIFVHLFLDTFNTYGTGLFEPFSETRISFHALYVIDPFFSLWPFLAFVFLMWLRWNHPARKLWARTGIIFGAIYLVYAISNKLSVDHDIRQNLAKKNILAEDYFITPTPLNSWLWFVVVKSAEGYYTAYSSVFDRTEDIDFIHVPQRDSLLSLSRNQHEIDLLKKFAQDFYTVELRHDSILVFNVLRFGQVTGWHTRGNFAFYYYLDGTGDNNLVVQRGRFENWNKETFRSLIYRIRGK